MFFEFPCSWINQYSSLKTILLSPQALLLTVTDGYSFITAINAVVYAIAHHKDTDSIISSFTSELNCDKVEITIKKQSNN